MLGKCNGLSPAGNGSARNSQCPQEGQLHTGILFPLSGFYVSLNAIGEEHWSFPQVTQRCLKCLLQFAGGKMLPLTGNTTGTASGSWCDFSADNLTGKH